MSAATEYDMKPEYLQEIPGTSSLVSIYRLRDQEGGLITNLTGFQELRIAHSLGCDVTNSRDWHLSMRYFQENPDWVFNGRTGKEIYEEFIAGNSPQRVATLLAFRDEKTGEFPENVRDIMKIWKIKGNIALIDFPHAKKDRDTFVPSVRTRVLDVTDNFSIEDGLIKAGFIQGYNEELGIPTAFGLHPDPNYNNAQMGKVEAVGTKQLIRGHPHKVVQVGEYAHEGMFHTAADDPTLKPFDVSIRLSTLKSSKGKTRIV